MVDPGVDIVVDAHAKLGEGPHWDAGQNRLFWVDILDCCLYVTAANGVSDVHRLDQPIGAVVPRRSDGVLLARKNDFALYDLNTKALTAICDPEPNLPHNRFNDGKCDARGRFWAGTMAMENPTDEGSLYRLDPDHSCRKMLGDIGISNGLAWSLDDRVLYYIDTLSWSIKAFDFDLDTGHLGRHRVVIEVPKKMGAPDGMTIDSDGMLWVAHYGGGRVCRWDPKRGSLLQAIILPVSLTTSCAFGDDDLATLFITSASENLSPQKTNREPHAGGLFAVRPGCSGVIASRFCG